MDVSMQPQVCNKAQRIDSWCGSLRSSNHHVYSTCLFEKKIPAASSVRNPCFSLWFFNGEIHDHENPPNQKNTHPELFLSDFSRMPNPTRGFSMPFFEAVPSKCFAQLLSLRSLVLAENSLEVGQNSLEVRESKSKVIPCDSCTSWCHLVDTFQ